MSDFGQAGTLLCLTSDDTGHPGSLVLRSLERVTALVMAHRQYFFQANLP